MSDGATSPTLLDHKTQCLPRPRKDAIGGGEGSCGYYSNGSPVELIY